MNLARSTTLLLTILLAGSIGSDARLNAEISPSVGADIDRIVGSKGTFIDSEGVYRVDIARPELKAFLGDMAVQAPHTWASFTSAVHHEALLVGQLAVLEDEINPVLTAVLDNGLEATALSSDLLSKAPAVLTLDIAGTGNFRELATALRKALDEMRRVRLKRTGVTQTTPKATELKTNNILAGPIDAILSMHGRVVDGIYTAAIGRRALLYGEPIAREMGITTSISISGTIDHALLHGQIIATTDELQNVLKALRAKGIQVASIRNHYVGEHPQYIFVHFWSEGPVIDLARSFRYVLDVQVGAASSERMA